MSLNIDTTNVPIIEQSIGQCQVVDLGTGAAPKTIVVTLPDSDGARVSATWTGVPQIAVNDFVRIRYYRDEAIPVVTGTSAGTSASTATITNTLGIAVVNAGAVVVNKGSIVWVS
jgi:hypothetical protein